MPPRVDVHKGFKSLEPVDVIIQSFVLLQLRYEARVGVNEPPALLDVLVRTRERHSVLLHDVGDDQGGGSGYSEVAVHEDVASLNALLDEGVGHWEIR